MRPVSIRHLVASQHQSLDSSQKPGECPKGSSRTTMGCHHHTHREIGPSSVFRLSVLGPSRGPAGAFARLAVAFSVPPLFFGGGLAWLVVQHSTGHRTGQNSNSNRTIIDDGVSPTTMVGDRQAGRPREKQRVRGRRVKPTCLTTV